MSSPGTSKTSRPMSSLPKDYHRAVSEMEINNLLRSTLRTHLGLAGSTKQVQLCKPSPEHCDCFTTNVCVKVLSVVKVLRFRYGIRGGNLGLMYHLLLQLDEFYSSRIDGLPEKVRTKVSPRCIVCHMVVYSESSSLRCHDGLVYRCTRFSETGGHLSTLPL